MSTFNPLAYRTCLESIPPPPEQSAWLEHIPFARMLIELLRPRVYVELGVASGASYLTVCQTIAALGLPCACYGIDTFAGDEHAGVFGGEVEARLRARHDSTYGGFSRLITSTFDEAAGYLSDGSIDLLHIDGLHTYQAVAHDFATWLPKLSPSGMVMFHDINVRERGFGVWRLWEELSLRYPHFSFKHGHGLGLLAVGAEVPPSLQPLLSLDAEMAERVADLFYLLGNRLTLKFDLVRHQDEIQSLVQKLQAAHAADRAKSAELDDKLRQLVAQKLTETALRNQIRELEDTLNVVNHSSSFRIGMMATAPLRWVTGKLNRT